MVYHPAQVGEPCICRVSHVLESLTDLRELHLARNHLTSLPASVWQLRTLVHLDLSRNRLKSLPQEVANLEQLEVRQEFPSGAQSPPMYL